jgi:hypothetical protein
VSDTTHLPLRGDFQWFGMGGAFVPSAEQVYSTQNYLGLEPEGTYFWGTFRDDEGGVYIFMRRMPFGNHVEPPRGNASIGRRAVLFYYPPGTRDFTVHPASMETGYNTQQTITLADDSVIFQSDADNKGKAFRAVYRAESLSYQEQDLLDLSGPSLKPGLQWYVPGRDLGIYYTSQTFAMDGFILGKKVSGYLFIEQAYMAEGAVLYALKDVLVGEKIHLTWYSWANEYDNGDKEFGHFIVGHDRMGIAIASNNEGIILQSSIVRAEIDRNADGYWSDRVRLDVDGEAWEVIQPADLRLLPTGHLPNGQQEGYVQKVGETRKRVRWMAWGETAPSHGDTRAFRYAMPYRLIG